MGAGHQAVGNELARRLRVRGYETLVVDLLEILPVPVGRGLRLFYKRLLRHFPQGYEQLYRTFFCGSTTLATHRSPLTALAARRLLALVGRWQPDLVITTFHVAAQAAGELRAAGTLTCPAVTVVTDFVAHKLWLHPSVDLQLCLHALSTRGTVPASGTVAVTGPVVAPAFVQERAATLRVQARRDLGIFGDECVAVLTAGSWGAGRLQRTVAALEAVPHTVVVVLCGHDTRLRRDLARNGNCHALGWVSDMPRILAAADVVVENAGGQSSVEAMAAGVPVITYEPIAGHGRDNARIMHQAGVSWYARSPRDLIQALRRLCAPGTAREEAIARGTALFCADPADAIGALLAGRMGGDGGGQEPENCAPPGSSTEKASPKDGTHDH